MALFIAIRQLVLTDFRRRESHILCGIFFNRLALADENFAVDSKQIASLHAGLAGNATDKQRPVHVAKAFRRNLPSA